MSSIWTLLGIRFFPKYVCVSMFCTYDLYMSRVNPVVSPAATEKEANRETLTSGLEEKWVGRVMLYLERSQMEGV